MPYAKSACSTTTSSSFQSNSPAFRRHSETSLNSHTSSDCIICYMSTELLLLRSYDGKNLVQPSCVSIESRKSKKLTCVISAALLPTCTSYSRNYGQTLVSPLVPICNSVSLTIRRSNERKRRQLFRGEVHGQLPFDVKGMEEPVPSIDFTPTRSSEIPYSLGRDDVDSRSFIYSFPLIDSLLGY